MTRLHRLTSTLQFEHLFTERQADLKDAGSFGNGQAAFFHRCHHTDS